MQKSTVKVLYAGIDREYFETKDFLFVAFVTDRYYIRNRTGMRGDLRVLKVVSELTLLCDEVVYIRWSHQ